MNTRKAEWARREIARIDAQLLAPRQREPSWRKWKAGDEGRRRMRARRARLAKIAGGDFTPEDFDLPF